MTLQTLLGKQVITSDGQRLGRIVDFVARYDGSQVLITHISVGSAAWIARLELPSALAWMLRATHEFVLPWEAIGTVEREVQLDHDWGSVRCNGFRARAGS